MLRNSRKLPPNDVLLSGGPQKPLAKTHICHLLTPTRLSLADVTEDWLEPSRSLLDLTKVTLIGRIELEPC